MRTYILLPVNGNIPDTPGENGRVEIIEMVCTGSQGFAGQRVDKRFLWGDGQLEIRGAPREDRDKDHLLATSFLIACHVDVGGFGSRCKGTGFQIKRAFDHQTAATDGQSRNLHAVRTVQRGFFNPEDGHLTTE